MKEVCSASAIPFGAALDVALAGPIDEDRTGPCQDDRGNDGNRGVAGHKKHGEADKPRQDKGRKDR